MNKLSLFGEKVSKGSGIETLMEDLGNALAGEEEMLMLGGGQPSRIPEMEKYWRQSMESLLTSGEFESVVGVYDPPKGNPRFIKSCVSFFQKRFGWDISEKNVCITTGGQTAFFFLFNCFAGKNAEGINRKILLPLCPEYIGYANQSIEEDFFVSIPPLIEKIGDHQFKYRIDFDNLNIDETIAAICVSRPTNPSGNVLEDEELEKLTHLAKKANVPLIIDGAYGAPFPNIFFKESKLNWSESIILTMSLSKVGLPGTRTGILVAQEDVIKKVTSMNAVVGLANNSLGQAIIEPYIENGEIVEMCKKHVTPYYILKSQQAQEWIDQYFSKDIPYRVHLSEGALFLWFWFEGMPISSEELYERLKQRKVLVVSGHHFFFGLADENWEHRNECIRMTFTMSAEIVEQGIKLIAEEVFRAFSGE